MIGYEIQKLKNETQQERLTRLYQYSDDKLIDGVSLKDLTALSKDLYALSQNNYHQTWYGFPRLVFYGSLFLEIFAIVCIFLGLMVLGNEDAQTEIGFMLLFIGAAELIPWTIFLKRSWPDILLLKENSEIKLAAQTLIPKIRRIMETKRLHPEREMVPDRGAFYKECANNGIQSLSGEFSRKKAIALLNKHMGVQSNHAKYNYATIIDKCFEISKEQLQIKKREAAAAKAAWDKVPHKAELSEENALKIKQADKISKLTGIEKRQYILEQNCLDIDEKIENMRQGEEAMRVFQGALVNASQEKKSDWAFLAGIADGIAGPGAGAAVATDIMIENEKIEMRNRQRREGISKTVNLLHQGIWDSGAKRHELEAARALLEEESDDLVNKVVLDDYTTQELFDQLSFYWCGVSLQEDNSLLVELKYTNEMQIDLPKEASVTIDGTFITKIYCGKTLVGQCYATLPLYGIPKDQTTTAIGICPMYMGGDPDYHVEIKPHRLWLMEL